MSHRHSTRSDTLGERDAFARFMQAAAPYFATAFEMARNDCRQSCKLTVCAQWRSRAIDAAFVRDCRGWPQPQSGEPLSPAVRVAQLLRTSPETPLDLDALARMAACSRSTLTRSFRGVWGRSIRDFHTRQRVRRALELLASTAYSVDAIAEAVGYRSRATLYVAFERTLRVTPHGARRLCRDSLEAAIDYLVDNGC